MSYCKFALTEYGVDDCYKCPNEAKQKKGNCPYYEKGGDEIGRTKDKRKVRNLKPQDKKQHKKRLHIGRGKRHKQDYKRK